MSRSPKTISKLFSVIILFSLVVAGCFEPVEACLDSNATNFDVYADDNCCCTYPTLNVNIIKHVNGEQFNSAAIVRDTFVNSLGQQYKIEAQSFYLSGMKMVYDNGSTSNVLDTLERPIPANATSDSVIEDNFGLIRQTSASYSAGSIKENGSIVNVNFVVGLDDQVNMLVPSQLPSSHPLGSNNQSDHFVEGEGYIFIRWVLKPIGISNVEEINVRLSGEEIAVNLSLDTPMEVVPGSITQIPLIVDYGKWLEGIDFAADQSTIEAQIAQNTSAAFSIQ